MLRWLVGEATWTAWRWAGWLDSQAVPFPGDPDRRMDTVATFERPLGDAPPLVVVVEFLTRPRGEVLERLAEYTQIVHREVPYQKDHPRVEYSVIGILVLLTGEMRSGRWEMRPPDTGGLGLSADVGVRNLSTTPARGVLEGVREGKVARAVLSFVPLMAGADDAEVADEWGRLAGMEKDEERKANLGGLARVFARLAERTGVWNTVLEGWNVERSPVVMEWEHRAELRRVRKDVLRSLQVRLKQAMPPDVAQVIEQQKDLDVLSGWFDQAVLAENLDQVRHFLGLTNGVPKQEPGSP